MATQVRLRLADGFSLGEGTRSYPHIKLSQTKQRDAERIARSVIKSFRLEGGLIEENALIDTVYDEASSVCGNSQYDDGRGHESWWTLREEIERLVIAVARAEMESK